MNPGTPVSIAMHRYFQIYKAYGTLSEFKDAHLACIGITVTSNKTNKYVYLLLAVSWLTATALQNEARIYVCGICVCEWYP